MVKRATPHPLRLVAPWYHWARQHAEPALGSPVPRATRPVFQKHLSGAEAVKLFLANPQRSYRFYEDEDRVHVTADSPYAGEVRKLASRDVLRTPLRLLFRETHRRCYLVTCEMHCDLPGLPDAAWDHVDEPGFVVRRWVPRDPAAHAAEIARLSERIGWLRVIEATLLGRLRTLKPIAAGPAWAVALHTSILPLPLPAQLATVRARLEHARAARRAIEVPRPDGWMRQYWRRDAEHDGVGEWVELPAETAEPATLAALRARRELTYPLYRAIPDPRDAEHLALGARHLFGVVPTSDMETTVDGRSHLDSSATYEIRCFVQQLRDCCSGRRTGRRCPGQLRWTQPTEAYRIAPHFDPVGAGNHVVNIEMPDLQTMLARPGKGFPIRLAWPEASKLSVSSGMPPSGPVAGGNLLCTTSIPLVTIVATFLLEIFTPIVVNLFGLYHLLLQRCCFPLTGGAASPMTAEVGAALAAEYEGPELAAALEEFGAVTPPSRTERLEWEPVLTRRPAVDAPFSLEAVA